MPTDLTPEALDDAIAACRAPMLAILKDASFGSISAQRQKQNIERFDAAITALRARLAAAEARLATARAALESAQESIAAFMGVHHYPIDSGAGDVLQQVSAALALIDQPAAPQPTPEAVARAALEGFPIDDDREWIDNRADELFRDSERQRGGVRPATITPRDYRDYFVVDATGERLAAIIAKAEGEWAATDEEAQAAATITALRARLVEAEAQLATARELIALLEADQARRDAQPTLAEALAVPEVAALVDLIQEARVDLADYVSHEWPEDTRARYPDINRRYQRDMDLCWRIDAALTAIRDAKEGGE